MPDQNLTIASNRAFLHVVLFAPRADKRLVCLVLVESDLLDALENSIFELVDFEDGADYGRAELFYAVLYKGVDKLTI